MPTHSLFNLLVFAASKSSSVIFNLSVELNIELICKNINIKGAMCQFSLVSTTQSALTLTTQEFVKSDANISSWTINIYLKCGISKV